MLAQVLRLYLAGEGSDTPSWLLALSDPRIGAAIRAIHAEPAKVWTVERLADVAGTSRSTLALRFKQTAGLAPLEYVSHWRMQLAARALRDSKRRFPRSRKPWATARTAPSATPSNAS